MIAGGPGTGKTRTIARLLAAAHHLALADGPAIDVALAAPTGKASARMTEAVHQEVAAAGETGAVAEQLLATEASTVHRLLGWTPGVEFRHDATNPLPHDLVVVDETSMVSLPLMARLLAAVRPDATLVLVGDPYQLASVEAGAVLGEIVRPTPGERDRGPLADRVVLLERVHRFDADSSIAALADAVRTGDADRALDLLRDDDAGELTWITDDDEGAIAAVQRDAAAHAVEVITAARAGDAERGLRLAGDQKVLSATRRGPLGTYRFGDRIEVLASRAVPPAAMQGRWYVGRPIIVTRNDYPNRLVNGDVGLVVAGTDRPVVAFGGADGIRELGGLPPRRDRDLVGDDDPQEPGIGVPSGRHHAAPGAVTDPDPGAAVHRRHPGQGARHRRGLRGRPARRDRPTRRSRLRLVSQALRRLNGRHLSCRRRPDDDRPQQQHPHRRRGDPQPAVPRASARRRR